MLFSEAFFLYLFSLTLVWFCCFYSSKTKVMLEFIEVFIYLQRAPNTNFKLSLFHWSDHTWSLWSYLPADTTGDHVTSFSTIICWRKLFTFCRTKSQMVWNHSDNKNIRERTTSFSQSGSSWVESDLRHVVFRNANHFSFIQNCQFLNSKTLICDCNNVSDSKTKLSFFSLMISAISHPGGSHRWMMQFESRFMIFVCYSWFSLYRWSLECYKSQVTVALK